MRGNPNPFAVRNEDGSVRGWDWCDERGFPSGRMYATHRSALIALLRYEQERFNPRRFQKMWWALREMLR